MRQNAALCGNGLISFAKELSLKANGCFPPQSLSKQSSVVRGKQTFQHDDYHFSERNAPRWKVQASKLLVVDSS